MVPPALPGPAQEVDQTVPDSNNSSTALPTSSQQPSTSASSLPSPQAFGNQENSISGLAPGPVEAHSEQVPALINELEVQPGEATLPPSSSVAYALPPASAEVKVDEEQASLPGVQNGEHILIFFSSSPNLSYPIASSIGHLAAT